LSNLEDNDALTQRVIGCAIEVHCALGPLTLQRRHLLLALATLPLPAHATASTRLAAAWDTPQGAQVGVLLREAGAWRVAAAIDVPTRAHGVIVEPDGALLAVARRPGDWLLRWRVGRPAQWHWSEGLRHFNGHARRHGALLYTTETDLESGEGRVAVRDARTLAVQALWPTRGADPHDLRFAGDGSLWVANGGLDTRPETGRTKHHLDRMDSSLVRLDARSGRLLGQWRLADARLSLRHLALHGARVGIALQAQHDDPAARAAAPVLAYFDGDRLRACDAAPPLAGYGGDIAATAAGFVVSVPRAGGLALFGHDGRWRRHVALEDACALTVHGARVLAAGRHRFIALGGNGQHAADALPLRVDNHWQAMAG